MAKDNSSKPSSLANIDEGMDLRMAIWPAMRLRTKVDHLLHDSKLKDQTLFDDDEQVSYFSCLASFNRHDKSLLNLNTVASPNQARPSPSFQTSLASRRGE